MWNKKLFIIIICITFHHHFLFHKKYRFHMVLFVKICWITWSFLVEASAITWNCPVSPLFSHFVSTCGYMGINMQFTPSFYKYLQLLTFYWVHNHRRFMLICWKRWQKNNERWLVIVSWVLTYIPDALIHWIQVDKNDTLQYLTQPIFGCFEFHKTSSDIFIY